MPRFSIIIPAYNVEKYILECLNSVQKQSFQDYEIILVNDGSIDETECLCIKASEKFEKIKYYRKENEGLSKTRNFGIDHAEGEYIYFLDADDVLCDDALQAINNTIKIQDNPDIIITNYIKFDNCTRKIITESRIPKKVFTNNSTMTVAQQFAECYIYGNFSIMAPLSIVKRKYLLDKELYFEEGILHEDELWTPQIFLNASAIAYCSNICYAYRVNREGSIMSLWTEKNLKDRILIITQMKRLALESSKQVSKMYLSRAACILNGIMTAEFEMDNSEEKIADEVQKHLEVFSKSIQKKYLVLYILIRIFGLKRIIKIEKCFKNEN